MKNYISQGLGRQQKLTQLVCLKIFSIKGLRWAHRGGQDPENHRVYPGTDNSRKLGPPLGLKDKGGKLLSASI